MSSSDFNSQFLRFTTKNIFVNYNIKEILSRVLLPAVERFVEKFSVNNLRTMFEQQYWAVWGQFVWDVDKDDVFKDVTITNSSLVSVSHTTDDLVFEWDPIMPLDVDSGIELPQLELTNNFTGDCTTAYSTGDTRIRWEREGIFCEKLGVNFIEWRGF